MSELLVIQKLAAGYGSGTTVIEDIEISLPAKAALALLGRNGVGKTTLLATLMGLTKMGAGKVLFRGIDITGLDTFERARAGIGYVPQEREIFPSLTVTENLLVARRDPGEWTTDSIFELFPRLAQRRQHFGNHLSGGEQQMLAIGRALMGNPALLLLDEPFEGLAPVIVEQLACVFQRIRRETELSLVLVEHHAELALGLTDRAVILDRGQIAWQGASQELSEDKSILATLVGLDQALQPEISQSI